MGLEVLIARASAARLAALGGTEKKLKLIRRRALCRSTVGRYAQAGIEDLAVIRFVGHGHRYFGWTNDRLILSHKRQAKSGGLIRRICVVKHFDRFTVRSTMCEAEAVYHKVWILRAWFQPWAADCFG